MSDKAEQKADVVPVKKRAFQLPATQGDVQEVFRLLFASDNSLIEMFQRPVVISMRDLVDLNRRLAEKLVRNGVGSLTFRALVRFEDGQAREFGTWEKFAEHEWDIPKVIDSISATWRFMLGGPDEEERPHIHNINILISSSIKPMNVMQALFSKNFEDLERLEITAMPMTCRIDFQDHVVSQEVLALVSEWNKGLNTPQHVFPFMQWAKSKHHRITPIIQHSIPVLAAIAAYCYYLRMSHPWATDTTVSPLLVTATVRWLAGTVAVLFLSCQVGKYLAGTVERSLGRFGRFQAVEITKGDSNRQTELLAKNARSFWKFLGAGAIAILWNIVSAVLAAMMIKKVQP